MIHLCNSVYYHLISLDPRVYRLLKEILCQSNLIQMKIRSTYETYIELYGSVGQIPDRRQLFLFTAELIGAESQLFLNDTDPLLQFDQKALCQEVLSLSLLLPGMDSSVSMQVSAYCEEKMKKFNIQYFAAMMDKRAAWFDAYQ